MTPPTHLWDCSAGFVANGMDYIITNHSIIQHSDGSMLPTYGWVGRDGKSGEKETGHPGDIRMPFGDQFFTCFMDRLMRWRFSSTDSTITFTMSPTFTTSLGWRRRRLQTSLICTRPS